MPNKLIEPKEYLASTRRPISHVVCPSAVASITAPPSHPPFPSNRTLQITHCGMGGLFECAANAVPVIPLPFSLSADQPVNARAAEAAGFAVLPRRPRWPAHWWRGGDPEVTADAITEAVDRAMHDPMLLEGARRARRAVLAAGYGRAAVDAVESA